VTRSSTRRCSGRHQYGTYANWVVTLRTGGCSSLASALGPHTISFRVRSARLNSHLGLDSRTLAARLSVRNLLVGSLFLADPRTNFPRLLPPGYAHAPADGVRPVAPPRARVARAGISRRERSSSPEAEFLTDKSSLGQSRRCLSPKDCRASSPESTMRRARFDPASESSRREMPDRAERVSGDAWARRPTNRSGQAPALVGDVSGPLKTSPDGPSRDGRPPSPRRCERARHRRPAPDGSTSCP
jgi:hypothetical protein